MSNGFASIVRAAKAEEHYDKALGILEHEPESGELASLYEDMAHMYYRTKDMTSARVRALPSFLPQRRTTTHNDERALPLPFS